MARNPIVVEFNSLWKTEDEFVTMLDRLCALVTDEVFPSCYMGCETQACPEGADSGLIRIQVDLLDLEGEVFQTNTESIGYEFLSNHEVSLC